MLLNHRPLVCISRLLLGKLPSLCPSPRRDPAHGRCCVSSPLLTRHEPGPSSRSTLTLTSGTLPPSSSWSERAAASSTSTRLPASKTSGEPAGRISSSFLQTWSGPHCPSVPSLSLAAEKAAVTSAALSSLPETTPALFPVSIRGTCNDLRPRPLSVASSSTLLPPFLAGPLFWNPPFFWNMDDACIQLILEGKFASIPEIRPGPPPPSRQQGRTRPVSSRGRGGAPRASQLVRHQAAPRPAPHHPPPAAEQGPRLL